jgi:ribonuclease VapC
MVIDTSALLAILQGEAEAHAFIQSIEAADSLSMSVGSFIETSIVIESRFGADGVRDLDLFIAKAGIELIACDTEQAHIARRAYREYGKGRHPAALNSGDCFAYALATDVGEPLLYKGEDFARTNVEAAF